MPSRSSSSTGRVTKPVHATAKTASVKWAAFAQAKPKLKAVELTSAAQKSSVNKCPHSASASDEEIVAMSAKKKHALPEIDEVVTMPEIVVVAEAEDEEVVEQLDEDRDEEEEVSLSFQLDVGATLTGH